VCELSKIALFELSLDKVFREGNELQSRALCELLHASVHSFTSLVKQDVSQLLTVLFEATLSLCDYFGKFLTLLHNLEQHGRVRLGNMSRLGNMCRAILADHRLQLCELLAQIKHLFLKTRHIEIETVNIALQVVPDLGGAHTDAGEVHV